MNKRKRTKLVHEGRYVAEVDVELIQDDTGWSPYLTPEDAFNDFKTGRSATAFDLRPVVSR